MPLTGYLTASAIEAGVVHLANTFPALCELIVVPEPSIEGRRIRAVRIGDRSRPSRPGILVIAGAHAREVMNPDMLLMLGLKLCKAVTDRTGLTFGSKTYDAATLKALTEQADLYFLPLVNPDGRAFVQSPTGNPMWRKNRNPNSGLPGKGVDLNRNYDFLWSSGIGTSSDSTADIYKGNGPFSEPETRNVRAILDEYPNIRLLLDVHSYSELVLYPWGDDPLSCDLANYYACGSATSTTPRCGNSEHCQTAEVNSYTAGASPYGTLNMAGNVWEWVADWYQTDYYSQSPADNPKGPANGDFRVIRGGGATSISQDLRLTRRASGEPEHYMDGQMGFRCAMDSGQP